MGLLTIVSLLGKNNRISLENENIQSIDYTDHPDIPPAPPQSCASRNPNNPSSARQGSEQSAGTLPQKHAEKDSAIFYETNALFFSALFGTPMAAAVFSMEVVSVGIMHYAALVPCVAASYIAGAIARYFGMEGERFTMGQIPYVFCA